MNESDQRRLRTTRFALSVYWLTMFIGSHLPVPPQVPVGNSDKFIHFGALAVLAFFIAFYRGQLGRMTWSAYLTIFAVAAAYGALDEWTQSFVGRTADPLDWLADISGAAVGLGAYWLYDRKKRPKLDVV